MDVGVAAFWTVFPRWLSPFQTTEYLAKSPKSIHALLPLSSLKLYVLLKKSQSYEKRLSPFSLVSLKDYLVVFGSSTAGTKSLELLCEAPQVLIFVIDPLHYRCWLPKFSGFAAYFYALLVFANFGTYAYVLWKSTCRTDFCHVTQIA